MDSSYTRHYGISWIFGCIQITSVTVLLVNLNSISDQREKE